MKKILFLIFHYSIIINAMKFPSELVPGILTAAPKKIVMYKTDTESLPSCDYSEIISDETLVHARCKDSNNQPFYKFYRTKEFNLFYWGKENVTSYLDECSKKPLCDDKTQEKIEAFAVYVKYNRGKFAKKSEYNVNDNGFLANSRGLRNLYKSQKNVDVSNNTKCNCCLLCVGLCCTVCLACSYAIFRLDDRFFDKI